jgi:AAA domain
LLSRPDCERSTAGTQSSMWIERAQIRGFRAIAGDFAFSPGLNLVVGDNEAGKSTLHDALIRSLYGFTGSERRRHRQRSVRDDCKPWDGRPFELVTMVCDANGHDYRIEWDFDAHRVRLLDGATDRSPEVQLRGDDVALGEFLIGIGLDDFRQVCCLDQEALEAVRHSPSLGLALQEAVAQIGGDVAAQEVIDRLDGFLRDRVGVRVDTLAPTPRGRITAMLKEHAEVVAALEDERRVREQIVDLAGDLERNRDEYRKMTTKIERTRQRLLLAEHGELAGKLDKARRLTARANERVEVPPLPPPPVVDRIHAAHVRLEQLGDSIEASERDVAQVAGEVETLERKERELDAELLRLASYARVDDSARDLVQRTWGELEGLHRAAPPPSEASLEPDPLLARYRSERHVLYALHAGASRWTPRRVAWTALVVVTLGVALLVQALIRRLRGTRPLNSELERRLAEYGAPSLAVLDERVAYEDRRLAAAQARSDLARSQASGRQERQGELERELVSALDASGAVPAGTVEARVQAYLLACTRHANG